MASKRSIRRGRAASEPELTAETQAQGGFLNGRAKETERAFGGTAFGGTEFNSGAGAARWLVKVMAVEKDGLTGFDWG